MTTISAPLAAHRPAPAPFIQPGVRRPRVTARLPWFRIALGSMAIVTGLVHLARELDPGRPGDAGAAPAAVLAAPEAGWPSPARLRPAYALDTLEFSGLPQQSEARPTNGGREDVLRIGAFEQPEPHLHLRAERSSGSELTPASFFLETARRASEVGLGVGRSAQPELLATKLGAAEVAPVLLSGASERSCLAFRLHRAESGLRLGGWICGAEGRPAEAREAACVIERLVPAPGIEDAAIRAVFAEAERQRDPACGPSGVIAQSDQQTLPFTAARTGAASRRKREKPPAMRSASRGQGS